MAVPYRTFLGGQALGQVQGHHHAGQTGADALQQSSGQKDAVPLRSPTIGTPTRKSNAVKNIIHFRPNAGQRAGRQGGGDAAQGHRRHDDRDLRSRAEAACQKVLHGPGLDSPAGADKQAAQARDA